MPIRRVLACDDDLTLATFQEWFAADRAERERAYRRGALRWWEVDKQICRTLAELRDALEESVDAGGLPDLVLIDDRLPPGVGGETAPTALKAVRLITSTFGEGRPKCVLHTSAPKLNEITAFCALGGHNVVDKFRPHERMRVLWETHDGGCWSPPQAKTTMDVTKGNARLLPYMEHPHWMLNLTSEIPEFTPTAIYQATSRLRKALDLDSTAEAREIVDAAHEHGLVWVPLAYRHWLAEDHPEHRANTFQLKRPPPKSEP